MTFTPAAGSTGAASFTYGISDDRGGTSSAGVSLTVSPAAGLFAANATPTTITENDPNAVELGTKFTASTDGTISGIRFYKGPEDTGTHNRGAVDQYRQPARQPHFHQRNGKRLADRRFHDANQITAGAAYVVGYHSNGCYSAESNYFASAVTNGPLTAPSSTSTGGNGIYAYGSTSAFPTSSFNASNYWVDVIFNGQLAA